MEAELLKDISWKIFNGIQPSKRVIINPWVNLLYKEYKLLVQQEIFSQMNYVIVMALKCNIIIIVYKYKSIRMLLRAALICEHY